jgi:hypothetical protein
MPGNDHRPPVEGDGHFTRLARALGATPVGPAYPAQAATDEVLAAPNRELKTLRSSLVQRNHAPDVIGRERGPEGAYDPTDSGNSGKAWTGSAPLVSGTRAVE